MVANLKQWTTTDAAAPDLWRVAEAGDVEELVHILPRVGDIDARNQHGMTALMRAAYHGHARMVSALLDHGADPNLTRNDRFTALALAAFFGHTETVRILIERGAKTEVITRCGASARMWATARTFDEAARCLETHVPASAPRVAKTLKEPASAPVAPRVVRTLKEPAITPVTPRVVKTLKEPPEIWELVQVQEVPKSFNARSVFLSRLESMSGSFALRTAAVLLVAIACVVGALILKKSQARSRQTDVAATQSAAASKVTAPPTTDTPNTPNNEPVVTASEAGTAEFPAPDAVRNHGARKTQVSPRPIRSRATASEDIARDVPSREEPARPSVAATPQMETRSSNKANSSLSPQLITPAKGAPPKAKVIQWP